MPLDQTYVNEVSVLIQALREDNPDYKDQVGHFILDFVEIICGPEKAPKVTGMLIELPIAQIKEYLGSFSNLQQRVQEAVRILNRPKPAPESDADSDWNITNIPKRTERHIVR